MALGFWGYRMLFRAIVSGLLMSAHLAPAFSQAGEAVSGSGTGFFVNSEGWAVTNAHVLDGCSRATVPGIGDAVDWSIDHTNDLAVVRVVGGEGKAYLPFRGTPPRLGEEIAAFGFPLRGILSESINVTTGNISSLVGLEDDTRYLQISTPLQPGNSGGPVVDHGGTLVGVAAAVLGSKFTKATGIVPQNVNFAIRSSVLEIFLQSRNIRYGTMDSSRTSLSTAELSEKVVPATIPILCYADGATVAPAPQTFPHSAAGRSFQTLDDHDVVGFDYATLKQVSLTQCQSTCKADPSCKALTYNKKERFCFLKSGAALIVGNTDAVTSVSESLSSDVVISTFVIRSGHDMAGGDYKRLRNSNFVGCYLACESDYICRAFAFVAKQKDCWLKNVLSPVSRKKGVELGVR